MKAKDIMIPIQEFLKPDQTLKEAVNLLRSARRDVERQGVKGLPVLDQSGKVIGMIYERDVFDAITSSMLDKKQGGAG